jgi:hypothetical protein
MVDQVQIPHSVIAGKKPLPAEVIVGGLALNLKDFTLYSKGYDGVVIRLTGVVSIENDEGANTVVYLPWVKEIGNGVKQYISSSKLSFNPASGQLRATSFAGDGSGLAGLAKSVSTVLPPPAADLASVIALANGIREILISAGIGK